MPHDIIVYIALIAAATLWLAMRHAIAMYQSDRQARIAHTGRICQGTIVAIQRPFILDSSTRLYFDFLPPGCDAPMRACHVARTFDNEGAALPIAGATVTVCYLPDHPRDAVIRRLVRA